MAVNHTEAMPPQLRAARVRKQRVIKAIILTFTLLFLFVPLVSMFVFTIRHPLSGKWSLDPWIAIFTGDGSALGADLSTLWSGLGSSMGLCVVTVVIMLLLTVVPHAILLSVTGELFPSAFSSSLIPSLSFVLIVMSLSYGVASGTRSRPGADLPLAQRRRAQHQPDLAVLRVRYSGDAICIPRARCGPQLH